MSRLSLRGRSRGREVDAITFDFAPMVDVVLLLVIAASNLAHAMAPAGEGVRPLGPMAALLFRVTGRELHPALVGVAFALSLDSLAQAAFFATHGSSSGDAGGIAAVALLAATFGAGMMLADAGNGLLLPAGPLREPLPQTVPRWRRVIYTAGVSSTPLPGVLALRSIASALPLAAWRAGDATAAVPLSVLGGRALVAVAGIGAPEKFFGMLREAGLQIVALPLPDHHAYDNQTALPWPADTPDVITTEKDAVKLDPQHMGTTRVWVVPLDLLLPQTLVDEVLALLFTPAQS